MKIHNAAAAAGIPCWVGGMLESSAGAAFCTALAMLDNFTYPADIFPSSRFYVQDLASPALELVSGEDGAPSVAAPLAMPEPVPERLEAMCVQRAVVE